ncbi:ATP-grasp domain-containing protein [Streptomyces sp. C11-1]|uniref:ATP-grasp domain-containing protein n=1 Tax=Streptomyces durocortorensis TaxID=2811104 RepID=A0ABY9W2T6_9ACTN|nr:ATP-grasp domain-containing protein [Streptomyces durocortorensis]WNF29200.1 ATP-grasp domain-containing protein [Streptomyces durocortorensis]
MTTDTRAPAEGVTHVLVGYGAFLMAELDRLLPEASLLILEEPHIIEARNIREAASRYRCVAEVRAAATQDEGGAGDLAHTVARPPRVRAVFPGVEYGVVAAAVLADAWGLPGGGVRAARTLRDKEELRRAAAAHALAQPAFAEATGPADVEELRARHGGECVLKPANRQASLGVVLLGPDDDAESAWRHTVGADEPRLRVNYPDSARYLVEERLHGPEFSVEALVHDGTVGFLNVTAKDVLPGRHPVELGHTVPAPPGAADEDALRAAMAGLVGAIGFGTGVLHAEWVLTGGRPHLIECAGRLPGDRIHSLIDLAYGGDGILADLLGLLAGEGPVPARPARRAAAITFLPAPAAQTPDAVVLAVTGADKAEALDGVEEVAVSAAPGQQVVVTTSSWQRAGYVIATGAGPKEAAATARTAASHITVTVGAP